MTIVKALKLTKSMKRSKYDIATINIDVHDVKYLPPSFANDILFVTPLVKWFWIK